MPAQETHLDYPAVAVRPAVRLGKPEFVVPLGRLRLAFFDAEIESVELVQYQSLVVAVNEAGEDILYVGAEVNAFNGPEMTFLGMFTANRHVTILNSPLLAKKSILFLAACALARSTLGLSAAQAPLTDAEIEFSDVLEELVEITQPNWETDSGSVELLNMICSGFIQPADSATARL